MRCSVWESHIPSPRELLLQKYIQIYLKNIQIYLTINRMLNCASLSCPRSNIILFNFRTSTLTCFPCWPMHFVTDVVHIQLQPALTWIPFWTLSCSELSRYLAKDFYEHTPIEQQVLSSLLVLMFSSKDRQGDLRLYIRILDKSAAVFPWTDAEHGNAPL